jgi:histidine ammonia-lyase
MNTAATFTLDGTNLSVAQIALLASVDAPQIAVAAEKLVVMAAARKLVHQAIETKTPVYGVTTGLGAQATKALSEDDLAAFSYQTVRGRAHAVGDLLPREAVRAALVIRLNTLLIGGSGASPGVAEFLVKCLNLDLIPAVGAQGSIGASDLVQNGTWALALIGEGRMLTADGGVASSAEVLQANNLPPLTLGPRDGLALCNNTSLSSAQAALGIAGAETAFRKAEIAAALTMQGFRANLSPFNANILASSPKPGQGEAATRILTLLADSQITVPDQARRLQDPLSIRNIPQIHGTVLVAIQQAHEAVMPELNGISDNPAVLLDEGRILSSGAYFTPQLTNALESVSRSFVHLTMAQIARLSKLLNPEYSGLSLFLSEPGTASNGFAPVMKTAEAIACDLLQRAQPAPVWPSVNANGTEDVLSATPTAAKALIAVVELSKQLTAIETLIAMRAIDMIEPTVRLGPALKEIYNSIRSKVPDDHSDRPLTYDIETIAAMHPQS